MSAENIDQIAENDLSLELYALPNKPTDAEVNISNSEPLSSLNHSPSARPDVESIISPRNSPKSLSVHDEDDELIEHQAHIADDEATEVNLNSVNDEVQDSTLMQHDSLNNNESSLDVNPNHSESNEITLNNNASKKTKDHSSEKISQFPLGRIKDIMKSDPDINIVSAECVFLIAKATEMFLQRLGKEIHTVTLRNKKKTLQKRDLDAAISEIPAFEFLEGALN